jgi:threonine dehydrogenase-like Zn-dependent dehydrogenase
MKAAIFDAPHQMHVGHWANPEPGRDDVLISVKAAGICAGDLYIYTGKNPYTKYPIIGGHEICGVLVGTGANVTGLEAGQMVVVEPFLSCGRDFRRKEMTILGSRTETNCFPEALESLARGQIRYPKFATAFDLWSAPAVFGEIARTPGSVHKGVFVRN